MKAKRITGIIDGLIDAPRDCTWEFAVSCLFPVSGHRRNALFLRQLLLGWFALRDQVKPGTFLRAQQDMWRLTRLMEEPQESYKEFLVQLHTSIVAAKTRCQRIDKKSQEDLAYSYICNAVSDCEEIETAVICGVASRNEVTLQVGNSLIRVTREPIEIKDLPAEEPPVENVPTVADLPSKEVIERVVKLALIDFESPFAPTGGFKREVPRYFRLEIDTNTDVLGLFLFYRGRKFASCTFSGTDNGLERDIKVSTNPNTYRKIVPTPINYRTIQDILYEFVLDSVRIYKPLAAITERGNT